MKSYEDIGRVYSAFFQDAKQTFPLLSSVLDRDLSRLLAEIENRGLHYCTVLLPELGKVFDRSLSKERLLLDEIPRGIKLKNGRPIIMGEVLSLVFDDNGGLLTGCDVTAIFFYRQLCYLMKKLRLNCSIDVLHETVKEFMEIDQRELPSPTSHWFDDHPNWDDSVPISPGRKLPGSMVAVPNFHSLDIVTNVFAADLGIVNPFDFQYSHGPGAVSDPKGTYTTKYEFPTWSEKLEAVFPYDWCGSGSLSEPDSYPLNVELPSKLVAVPKTQKGPRLICCESISHQWAQQGLRRWLEEKIRQSSIRRSVDFRSQVPNRMGALKGSSDGSLCTIDLSAASDRVSCDLVHYVFRNNSSMLDALHACRTRICEQRIIDDLDSHFWFHKFAPMGSSLTFPIQSIIFTLICISAMLDRREIHPSRENIIEMSKQVRVFGDDIIVPTDDYSKVCNMLEACGLKVNANKSFSEGKFRESCGVDAWGGFDVTPGYFLSPLDPASSDSLNSYIEVSNNFHLKGLWNLSRHMLDNVRDVELSLIPIVGINDERQSLSAISFVGSDWSHLKMRYNHDLQRYERRMIHVTARITKRKPDGYSNLTQYFTERPDPMFPYESGQVAKVTVRKTVAWSAIPKGMSEEGYIT